MKTKKELKETLSKAQLDALIKENKIETKTLSYGEGDTAFNITVYKRIPFIKRTELINNIKNSVFLGDKETIEDYAPEYLSLAQKFEIIAYYTDFIFPKNIEDMWFILNCTSIYHDVCAIIMDDINQIFYEADKGIEAKVRYLENKTDSTKLFDKIGEKIKGFTDKINFEDTDKVISLINNLKGSDLEKSIKKILEKN